MENQEFESLTLCPLDGRYSGIKDALGEYFSEYALVKYRVFVEIQWLKFLIENIDSDILAKFNKDDIYNEFDLDSNKDVILFFAGGEFGLGRKRTHMIFRALIRLNLFLKILIMIHLKLLKILKQQHVMMSKQ